MPQLDPVSLGIVACICGRLSNKRHCPHCGCYTVYGLTKKVSLADPNTGALKEWDMFRCRGCGKYFNDFEWQFDNCHAPEYRLKRTDKLMTEASRLGAKEVPVLVNQGKPFNNEEMQKLMDRAQRMREEADKKLTSSHATESENKLIEDLES